MENVVLVVAVRWSGSGVRERRGGVGGRSIKKQPKSLINML